MTTPHIPAPRAPAAGTPPALPGGGRLSPYRAVGPAVVLKNGRYLVLIGLWPEPVAARIAWRLNQMRCRV